MSSQKSSATEPPLLKNQPAATPLKQQRLGSISPTPNTATTILVLTSLSLVFLIVGVLILVTARVEELAIDYTECESVEFPATKCSEVRRNRNRMNLTCTCLLEVKLETNLTNNIVIYYKLENFFQNHRRYVRSRDDVQLNGQLNVTSGVNTEFCSPFDLDDGGNPIAPCGAIANSIFNDTFSLTASSTGNSVAVARTGIVREREKNDKFRNPTGFATLSEAFKGFGKPPYWGRKVDNLDSDKANNGFVNEALIVWMRPAPFATFRKKYGIIRDGLAKGNYVVTVNYNFPVSGFGGRKLLVISQDSWLGPKNNFLGVAYTALGGFMFVVAVLLRVAASLRGVKPFSEKFKD